MYAEMQACGLPEFILFLCTSAPWGQSCLLVHLKEWQVAASCIPPAPQPSPLGRGSIRWIAVLGALIHVWRPVIAYFLLIPMAGDIFISQDHVGLLSPPAVGEDACCFKPLSLWPCATVTLGNECTQVPSF